MSHPPFKRRASLERIHKAFGAERITRARAAKLGLLEDFQRLSVAGWLESDRTYRLAAPALAYVELIERADEGDVCLRSSAVRKP